MRRIRVLVIVLIVYIVSAVGCMAGYAGNDEGYSCLKHGRLEDSEVAYIDYAGLSFEFCSSCVVEFIRNNEDSFNGFIEAVKGE